MTATTEYRCPTCKAPAIKVGLFLECTADTCIDNPRSDAARQDRRIELAASEAEGFDNTPAETEEADEPEVEPYDEARFLLEQQGELEAENAWLRHAERPDFTDRDFYPQAGW